MKKLLIEIQILLLVVFSFYSCMDEKGTNPDTNTEYGNYFPNTPGSDYKYEVTAVDSNGNALMGNRFITYDGDSLIDRTNYQIQLDTIEVSPFAIASLSFFRTTSTGVFYYFDTTGVRDLVPDSIKSSIDLQTEMRLFLFPFIPGNSWTVYRVSYDLNNQIGYNIVDFSAKYSVDETLQLNLNGTEKSIDTKKIDYLLTVQNDPETSPQNYEAAIWLADKIGIVKMEGDAAIPGILNGDGIILPDSAAVITQKLVEYNVN